MGGGGGGSFGGYNAGAGSQRGGGQGPTAVSGNFIHAKRRGVVRGVDFLYTGDVVAVDVGAVRLRLAQGDVVLLSSLGEGCRLSGAGCRVQGVECRVQDAGCRVQGARCMM